jgi:bzd-type benzoyl-CoA reductase N subunit
MDLIGEFNRAFTNRYQLAKERKAQGQKVIGWICLYAPEEIIFAAGFHPMRLVGGTTRETPAADSYLYSNNCTFSRSLLEEGFNHNLDFLDGLVACNTCDHIRRTFDSWIKYLHTPFTKILGIPCKISETTLDYFNEEIQLFKEGLEGAFGVQITDEALWEAIRLYNRSRSLLTQLYELRKQDPPPILGSEVADVIRAGWALPRQQYNELLEELLVQVERRDRSEFADRPRMLLFGSELDDPKYYRAIEDEGAIIVADLLCGGARYFWQDVKEDGDPLKAIAYRYLTRAPCNRMHPAEDRVGILQQTAQDFHVDGVIHQSIKFCDNYAGQFPIMKRGLEEIDIPVLHLEREYIMSAGGQLRTRVGASLEGREAQR